MATRRTPCWAHQSDTAASAGPSSMVPDGLEGEASTSPSTEPVRRHRSSRSSGDGWKRVSAVVGRVTTSAFSACSALR